MGIIDRFLRKRHYEVSEEAYQLTRGSFVVDLHGHTNMAYKLPVFLDRYKSYADPDAKKLEEGGISLQAFSVVSTNYKNGRMRQIWDRIFDLQNMVKESSKLEWALSGTAAEKLETGKIGAFIGLEGMHTFEGDLDNLYWLHKEGVRYISLTHFGNSKAAYSSTKTEFRLEGITDFGRKSIELMNELGIIVDVSHVNRLGSLEAISHSEKPVIASHAGALSVDGDRLNRNLTDYQIRSIAEKGGVIGMIFCPWFVGWQITDVFGRVADHIGRVRNVGGIDCIALGSDFTGFMPLSWCPKDASQIPVLTQILLDRHYSEDDIRKVLGLNFLRVYKEVCG